MSTRRLFLWLLPVILITGGLLQPSTSTAKPDKPSHRVKIVTSSGSSYQMQTAAHINEQLTKDKISSTIISPENITPSSRTDNTIFISIGQAAKNRLHALNIEAPILEIALSYPIPDDDTNHAHLILEQQNCRDIKLVRALNKNWKSIGVLSSINSVKKSLELTQCAIKHNFNLVIYTIKDEKDLARTLEEAVENNNAILAIIDPLIYNGHTIKNILLSSYRSRHPIIGYSESFVNAGAIAGIYSSPMTTGRKAAEIISGFIKNNSRFDARNYYPSDFIVKTNRQVADSLDIDLPDDDHIRQQIINMENQ